MSASRELCPRKTLLDLSQATEQEIVAAFAKEEIETHPPLLPASMPGAIEVNRKILTSATGVIDAWRYSDSRLAPLCVPGSIRPDVMTVLTVLDRMLRMVVLNLEAMARLYPKKTCEEKQV